MIIQIASDLHFESYRLDQKEKVLQTLLEPLASTLVLAGDIINLCRRDQWWYFERLVEPFENVIYIPGNHEYWHQDINTSENNLRELDSLHNNLHVLSHATKYSVTINGQRFIGDTSWVPRTPAAELIDMGNEKCITGDFKNWAFDNHQKFREYLDKELCSEDVLVTHFLPTWRSVSPQFRGSITNCWFVGSLEDILVRTSPKLIIHGHTHHAISTARLVCNPHGYPGEDYQGYEKCLTVELQ
jgi:Icc-related predicted phosphoesterase